MPKWQSLCGQNVGWPRQLVLQIPTRHAPQINRITRPPVLRKVQLADAFGGGGGRGYDSHHSLQIAQLKVKLFTASKKKPTPRSTLAMLPARIECTRLTVLGTRVCCLAFGRRERRSRRELAAYGPSTAKSKKCRQTPIFNSTTHYSVFM